MTNNNQLPISWKIEKRKIKDLKPHPKNPRKLSKHDADHLKQSLSKFGLIDKPIITQEGIIIGGHQRVSVLKRMGHKEIECYVPETELIEKDIEELNIRLNRNAGEWDYDILANEWGEKDLMEFGFSEAELSMGEAEEVETPESSSEKEKGKKNCPNCGHQF